MSFGKTVLLARRVGSGRLVPGTIAHVRAEPPAGQRSGCARLPRPRSSRILGGWFGCLDDRGVQAGARRVGGGDSDGGESGGVQQVEVLLLGQGAVDAAGPVLGVG